MNSAFEAGGAKGVCAVTGAHGYVGSMLCHALRSAGWRVVSLSRRAARSADEISWSLEEPGSAIADELKARAASTLIHAAWDLRLVRPRDLERVNVQGSLRLLAQAQAANLRRVVFISTISAFEGARSRYGQTKFTVERVTLGAGGIVLRPGMVYGENPGGMFAALKQRAMRSSILPLIGDGSYPQYLVHEDDLAAAVAHALSQSPLPGVPVTVAHPHPWPLRALFETMAGEQARALRFVSVPWPIVYRALRLGEAMGIKMDFRSDSVLSLVFQNPHPELNAKLLGVEPRPFPGRASAGPVRA